MQKITRIKYRSDIQILRALAVIAVILFTLINQYLSMDIGVDIFFVISGFVISNLIYSKLSKNEFRLKEFIFKRSRESFQH